MQPEMSSRRRFLLGLLAGPAAILACPSAPRPGDYSVLKPNCSGLVWSTYLGGGNIERAGAGNPDGQVLPPDVNQT